tara:strand:- start:56 stop:292 length:237 start_codon:yes stop_codon:yes gene_type:complete
MANLTEQELDSIKKLTSDFNKLKVQLGDTVISQNILLKEIDKVKALFYQQEEKLIEKYGKDAVINIQTGEVDDALKEN